jgi:hypothetical protein
MRSHLFILKQLRAQIVQRGESRVKAAKKLLNSSHDARLLRNWGDWNRVGFELCPANAGEGGPASLGGQVVLGIPQRIEKVSVGQALICPNGRQASSDAAPLYCDVCRPYWRAY